MFAMFRIKAGVTKNTQEKTEAHIPLAVRIMMSPHVMEPPETSLLRERESKKKIISWHYYEKNFDLLDFRMHKQI